MLKNVESVPVMFDLLLMVGFLGLACIPLARERTRARWAVSVSVVGGTLGAMVHVVMLGLRMHWITLGQRADVSFEMLVSDIDNILLGLIFALIISGQLRGFRESENVGRGPAG